MKNTPIYLAYQSLNSKDQQEDDFIQFSTNIIVINELDDIYYYIIGSKCEENDEIIIQTFNKNKQHKYEFINNS